MLPVVWICVVHLLPAGAHVGVALLPPPEKLKVAGAKPAKGSKSKALPAAAAAAAGGAAGGSQEAGSSAAAAAGAVAPRGLPGMPLQAAAPGPAAALPSLEEQKKRPGQLMLTQMRARGQRGASARSASQPACQPPKPGPPLPMLVLPCAVLRRRCSKGVLMLCMLCCAVTPFLEKMAKRMDDMAEAAEMEVGGQH